MPDNRLNGGTKYAVAIMGITLIGVIVYFVVIALRPTWDSLQIIGSIVTAASVVAFNVLTFMRAGDAIIKAEETRQQVMAKAEETRAQSLETYHKVDGQMDLWKKELRETAEAAAQKAYAAGVKQGMTTGSAGLRGHTGERGEPGPAGAAGKDFVRKKKGD